MFRVVQNFCRAKVLREMMMAAKPSKSIIICSKKGFFHYQKKPFLSKQRKLNGFVLFCFYKATGTAYIFVRNSFSYFFKESTIEIWVR